MGEQGKPRSPGGKCREEGFLDFVGRKDDHQGPRREGQPREVESALHDLPGISEAAVVGATDPILGHAIKAVIVPSPGSSPGAQDVQRHRARRLEGYMVPAQGEFRDELPKS